MQEIRAKSTDEANALGKLPIAKDIKAHNCKVQMICELKPSCE